MSICTGTHNHSNQSTKRIFLYELAHHLPYATFSVALCLLLLSLLDIVLHGEIVSAAAHAHTGGCGCCHGHYSVMDNLFHSFHFIHMLFAVSGTMVTFYRYSKNLVAGIIVGIVSSTVFCTLSDILVPYLSGVVLGVDMELHICFFSELPNILPFFIIGIINGLVMYYIKEFTTAQNSLQLHFLHTFVSAMASAFYAVGHGFSDFHAHFGPFFLLILVAVVLPCTLSDVVVPIIFARTVTKK